MNLNEIKESLINATPGPWVYQQGGYARKSIVHQAHNDDLVCSVAENLDGDGYLIANAPEWLASLVEQVEWLEKIDLERKADFLAHAEMLKIKSKQVEEMQKTLEFYAEPRNWELPNFGRGHSVVTTDRGNLARQTLQSLKGEKHA